MIRLTKNIISKDRINELFFVDPINGIILWKSREFPKNWNSRFANKIAGIVNDSGHRIISVDYLHIHYLGRFKTIEEATTAYEIAAKKFFGEFARVSTRT